MSGASAPSIDPVTVEVVRNSLPAAANEMATDLQRSSYNMMIYEVRDYCCAILGPSGELLAQNVGGVSHFVADLGVIVKDAVERFGLEGFRPGDGYVMNHQRVCGQHLNNVVTYTPIFTQGLLFGFSMVRAHWVDVGGLSTGFGATGTSADPWLEGLQLDQVKVVDGGRSNEDLLRLIQDNIRHPESSMGDLRAQLAACRLGERRVNELVARYGIDAVQASVGRIFEDSQARARAVVQEIPDGEYVAESLLDHDFVDRDEPILIRAKVIVTGSDMTIDLSECSRQRRGGLNSRTRAGAFVAYKALTVPDEAVNEGSFAALKVVMGEGTFMMATYPAPMASWGSPMPTVVDTILRALADAVPNRVPAAHFGTLGAPVAFFGTDPTTQRRFVVQSIEGGGWGGRPSGDGPSASVSVCQGDVRNAPIESLELKFPVRVESRRLRTDSGGAGRFRGGLGAVTEVRNLVAGTWSMTLPGRHRCPPWGLWGGAEGDVGGYELQVAGAQVPEEVEGGRRQAPVGSLARIVSGGGGGWGDPLERPEEDVRRDVVEGYVSEARALEAYGVVLQGPGREVAGDMTRQQRRRLKSERQA